MWKYINSNELYHAWPKGYKRGPDGTPLGYVSNFKPIRKYLTRRRGYAPGPAIIDGKEEYI